ncbi:MAG TPA: glycosyltransferase family 39 protein [Acidisarcina sp.]
MLTVAPIPQPSAALLEACPPPEPARCHIRTILTLAAIGRLLVLRFILVHYPRGWLFSKGEELGFLGRVLALGQGFHSPFGGVTGPTAFLAPGYPFVISLFFRIFGIYSDRSAAAILLLHVIFSLITVALVVDVARWVGGTRVANLAGFYWALSPTLVWMPVIFWDTCASTMLLTGAVAVALRLGRRPSLALWMAAGLCSGLTLLINPSLFVALLAIGGWAVFANGWPGVGASASRSASGPVSGRARRGSPWLAPAAGLLVLAGVFAPWPIRNAVVLHAFIPFRSNLGYELWNGNQHGGNGCFVPALHPVLSRQQYREYASLGEVRYMEEKSALGKALIRAYPLEFVRVTAWRAPAFWLGLSQGEDGRSGLVVLHAAMTSCLGTAGLVLLFRRKRRLGWLFLLPLLVFPLPYYITHPDFRFRLLLDPLVTILAAYALTCGWRAYRRRYPAAASQGWH